MWACIHCPVYIAYVLIIYLWINRICLVKVQVNRSILVHAINDKCGFNFKTGKRGKQSMKNLTVNSSSKKKVVWTHECYYLAGHLHNWVPSSQEKMILAANGLGIKRLDFTKMRHRKT